MQAVVIDVYASEAFLSLQDGTNICVGLAHLPSSIKAGSTVNINVNSLQMTSHKVSPLIL
ncbi:hypothetical protein NBE98_14065 [Clostridium swellfunianum]|uniref:hypothetical protein n=1 Tax=Clostridium swellfunianum TaxID=1367462 RepID=UPI00202E9E38|nr:hypothetical protein [Clostridium swellfunianum]MCM0649488.1 hypothetical protein [Clostridium swellfunianum]